MTMRPSGDKQLGLAAVAVDVAPGGQGRAARQSESRTPSALRRGAAVRRTAPPRRPYTGRSVRRHTASEAGGANRRAGEAQAQTCH